MNNQVNRSTNMYCILGFILSFIYPVAGLPISIIGLNQVKKTLEPGREFAIAGIWISSVMLAIVLLCLIFIFFIFIFEMFIFF